MSREAISVTLDRDNLLWLRARARAAGGTSVSQLLDGLVTDARAGGRSLTPPRSVVGTVTLRDFDPDAADRDLRDLFAASAEGAGVVHERKSRYGRRRRGPRD